MTRLSCAAGCTLRGRHLDDCGDPEQCRGCLPALAADGLQVCEWHREQVWKALRGLETLWVDVEASGVLKAPQGGRRGAEPAMPLDVEASDWRWRVRACLVGWCKVLEEDFGVSLDDAQDTISWMVSKLKYQADRVLAHPEHADQLCADLLGWTEDDGKRHTGLMTEGRRLEGRGAAKALTILCDCGDRVKVEPAEDAYMTCPTCGETGVWKWWQQRLAPETEDTMTAAQVVQWLRSAHRITLTEATLRQWVSRGKLTSIRSQSGGASTFRPQAVALVAMSQREVSVPRPRTA